MEMQGLKCLWIVTKIRERKRENKQNELISLFFCVKIYNCVGPHSTTT